ncbi:MAG: hypothetical protein A2133_01765 [Actinobacteria bacterium RBG_16_64_13]|nr:MAG: hypothetical protein A2133_01765 [Actinobacteria bacterium RBG_16_64_13]
MSTELEQSSAARQGQALVLALASALRTAVYYSPGNAVMRQVCAALQKEIVEQSRAEGLTRVGVHSHSVYVNRARVSTTISTYGRFSSLIGQFNSWGISSLLFMAGISEEELLRALVVLANVPPAQVADLPRKLYAAGVEKVELDYNVPGKGTRSTSVTPIVAYTAAMQLGSELGQAAGSFEAGMVRRVRHVTQAVVDQILRDPVALLALTTVKDLDRYLILHSTNVAVLSTLLGQRMGLDKTRLGELCLAGFLHDAGKLGVDPGVLHKPGFLDAREWEEMRRHPVLAAYALLSNQRLNVSNMRAVVVAFEHHLNYDLSGYPRVEIKNKLTLFGGIVAIADLFDALTTARVYRGVNPTPPEAIANLVKRSGTHFDSTLVKLFVEVMGIYPSGTVLALTGREAGVVCRPPALGSPLDRPMVRVVVGKEPGHVVDLNERVNGQYVRSAVAVLNPSNRGQIPAVDPATLSSFQ